MTSSNRNSLEICHAFSKQSVSLGLLFVAFLLNSSDSRAVLQLYGAFARCETLLKPQKFGDRKIGRSGDCFWGPRQVGGSIADARYVVHLYTSRHFKNTPRDSSSDSCAATGAGAGFGSSGCFTLASLFFFRNGSKDRVCMVFKFCLRFA